MVEAAAAEAAAKAAAWQTGIAVVQAVCSITLLAWYVLAAHLDRVRVRRERLEDFRSLVRLCRDLGMEAKTKTQAHLAAIEGLQTDPKTAFGRWKSDMVVIYICLNEAPHYEVRNPAFSTALTRLWMEVDTRSAPATDISGRELTEFLSDKYERICAEVAAMAALLSERDPRLPSGPAVKAQRRGYAYNPNGSIGRAEPYGPQLRPD